MRDDVLHLTKVYIVFVDGTEADGDEINSFEVLLIYIERNPDFRLDPVFLLDELSF